MSAQNPVSEGEIFLGNEPVWENEKALSNICFSREFTTNPTGVGNMKMKQYLKTASVFYPYWDDEMAEKLVKLFELDTNKVIINLSKGMMSMAVSYTHLGYVLCAVWHNHGTWRAVFHVTDVIHAVLDDE